MGILRKKWFLVPLAAVALAALAFAGYSLLRQDAMRRGTRVVLYDGPEGVTPSAGTSITVNGQPLFVYETAVNHNRAFTEYPALDRAPVAIFDFEGRLEVRIKTSGARSALVRPLKLGIKPRVADGEIRFAMKEPANLVVEVNGDAKRAIHLFANPIEADPPQQGDTNVVYFGPGVHELPVIRLKSGQTLYLAGGAVVRSKIVAEKADGIRIAGRGVIDGSAFDRWTQLNVPISLRLCNDVRIDGITILDPAGWTISTFACADVLIDNVKIISARPNGDGITAQSCEIGYETRGPEIANVTFEGITVLHNFHKPVLSIHNSDQAHVHDIRYRDITVEDAQMGEGDGSHDNFLIDLTVAESGWSASGERGSIENVSFENIRVLDGKFPPSRIMGFDDGHAIKNVTISDLVILGRRIASLEEGQIDVMQAVDGVSLR